MPIFALCLALAGSAPAQTAPALPATPAPVGRVTGENLDEIFQRFASGRPMIPTLREVQESQLKRDLAPRASDGSPAVGAPAPTFAGRGTPARPGERRTTLESVDVAVSRPLPRLEFGLGASQRDVETGNLHQGSSTSKYAFASLDLSRTPLKRKFLHSPTAVHAQIEIGDKVRVESDGYTTDFLKHPR
jgi:hypothetical protein